MKIQLSNFAEVLPIWKNDLWPDRKSPIEATSALDLDGSINMNLMNSKPTFLVSKDQNNKIIGVISGFRTSDIYFRSRGLWVSDSYRRSGIAKELMNELKKIAKSEGSQKMWTMPRQTAWPFYQSVGFKKLRETNEHEFGPHYFAEIEL